MRSKLDILTLKLNNESIRTSSHFLHINNAIAICIDNFKCSLCFVIAFGPFLNRFKKVVEDEKLGIVRACADDVGAVSII